MGFDSMMSAVNEAVEDYLADAKEARASDLGLDTRAFWGEAFVTVDCIAVRLDQDRSLQYYGGFEYVNKEYRVCAGDWVFYMAEDDRVREHLAHVFEDLREECDEDA